MVYNKLDYNKGVKIYKKKFKPRSYMKNLRFARQNLISNVHSFKFKYFEENWLGVEMGTDAESYFSRDFKLSNLPNSAELVVLFDLYRINKVIMKITPRYTSNLVYIQAPFTNATIANAGQIDAGGTNLLGSSNMGLPSVITVIDYDDVTTPTSINELYEYSTVKKTLCNRNHTRTLIPRIKVDETNTSVSMAKRWLSTAASDVEHFGIKGCVANIPNLPEQGGNRPIFFLDLELTFYISLRNTK